MSKLTSPCWRIDVGATSFVATRLRVSVQKTSRRCWLPLLRRGDTVTQALLFLFLIWAVLLVPLGVRRRQVDPQRTVDGFERAMGVLARETNGAPPQQHVARRVSALQQRRLQLFAAAVRGVAVTAVGAVVVGGWMWLVFAFTLATTAAYAAVLRQAKRQRERAAEVVRELQEYRTEPAAFGEDAALAAGSRSVRLKTYGSS